LSISSIFSEDVWTRDQIREDFVYNMSTE